MTPAEHMRTGRRKIRKLPRMCGPLPRVEHPAHKTFIAQSDSQRAVWLPDLLAPRGG